MTKRSPRIAVTTLIAARARRCSPLALGRGGLETDRGIGRKAMPPRTQGGGSKSRTASSGYDQPDYPSLGDTETVLMEQLGNGALPKTILVVRQHRPPGLA